MAKKVAEIVILAAGDFPKRGGRAWQLLATAAKVVCCDSAADVYRRHFRRQPDAVVGDCDSVKGHFDHLVKIAEQDSNDLTKAVLWCRAQGWQKPVIVGATGKRDDHTLGNIFRALDLGLEVVTDYGRFLPLEGRRTFSVQKGQAVSVFATHPATQMTSRGLAWPLAGVSFSNLYCATLNRATASRVTLTTTHRVYLYLAS